MHFKKRLLEKLSSGTANEAELHLLFDLLSDKHENDALNSEINITYLIEQEVNLDKSKSEFILKNINDKIERYEENQYLKQTPKSTDNRLTKSFKLNWISRAAVLIMLISAGFTISTILSNNHIFISTSLTEMKTIHLPDGSNVILNENSKITYPSKWDDNEERIVSLEGEAYFEVGKKPTTNSKFKVKTNGLTIEVLGTIFNIKNSKDSTLVYLEEGKVTVRQEGNSKNDIEMSPGELIKYAKINKSITKPLSAKAVLHTSWKKGVLEFKNLPFSDIINQLNNESALRIRLKEGSSDNSKYSIAIPINSLEAAKAVIEKTTGHNVLIESSNTLIITTQ